MAQIINPHQEIYQSHFDAFERSLNGEASHDIHAVRRKALDTFFQRGFPTTRDEEWRFTNVAPITRTSFKPVLKGEVGTVTAENLKPFVFGGLRCNRLVFVNGQYSPDLSSVHDQTSGVQVGSLAEAIRTNDPVLETNLTGIAGHHENAFTALNTAFLLDGALVIVPASVALDIPIHLIFVSTSDSDPFMSHPRNLIIAGKEARLSIVESYVSIGEGTYLTNAVTEIYLHEGAVVEHDKLQNESEKAFHVGSIHVHQQADSDYTANSISLGGAIVRNDVTVTLAGERCESTLNGLSLATRQQLVDNHTTIDHAMPHCNSHELYKAILDGQSRGVFNGKIFVRRDAQKTDAKQTNKTLLLSDDAMIDTKPQLEIFADDVKCTHGATVGQLDEEQVFYLRARGMDLEQARDILTFAFASDVVAKIHVEPLREQLDFMVHSRLQHGRLETVSQ